MIKLLVLALCGAGVAAWAWSRRRQHDTNCPVAPLRSITPAVPAEDKQLEQVKEVTVPTVQENIPQQGNLVALPSGSKNPSEPAPSGVHEAAPDSGGNTTEQTAVTNPVASTAEPEKLTAPSVGQIEQPAPSPGNVLPSPNATHQQQAADPELGTGALSGNRVEGRLARLAPAPP
jgi:hypothetical protein